MKYKLLTLVLFLVVIGLVSPVWAGDEGPVTATETPAPIATESPAPVPLASSFDPLKYTLGPDDAVDVSVMRHPEFSGVYPVNAEGKIQYKFVGDMEVVGLTKAQLEQRIRDVLSVYVKDPEVSVTVTEYRSKYFYVLGKVGTPGKYYMRGDTVTVREAVFEAGLPTEAAAMRKCQLITPSFTGKQKVRPVNLYEILYGGNLKLNINMSPGDILYVPSTVMAKVISVISPVTTAAGVASGGPESASTARTAADTLSGRPGR